MKKRKLLITIVAILHTALLLGGCSSEPDSGEILVSAAASMKESMLEIETLYESKYPDNSLVINYGSSGSLQTQIEQGSPVDVFISASQSKMNNLEEKDLIVLNSRKNLLENTLVLIVPKDGAIIASFDDLASENLTSFAIGEPDSVPAGKYAKEALESLDLMTNLSNITVYAKDVKQVLTWVETGDVDGGMVYSTDANTSDQVTVVATAQEGTYTPIEYPVAIIEASQEQALAQEFIDFLYTDEAKAIFEKYGFTTIN